MNQSRTIIPNQQLNDLLDAYIHQKKVKQIENYSVETWLKIFKYLKRQINFQRVKEICDEAKQAIQISTKTIQDSILKKVFKLQKDCLAHFYYIFILTNKSDHIYNLISVDNLSYYIPLDKPEKLFFYYYLEQVLSNFLIYTNYYDTQCQYKSFGYLQTHLKIRYLKDQPFENNKLIDYILINPILLLQGFIKQKDDTLVVSDILQNYLTSKKCLLKRKINGKSFSFIKLLRDQIQINNQRKTLENLLYFFKPTSIKNDQTQKKSQQFCIKVYVERLASLNSSIQSIFPFLKPRSSSDTLSYIHEHKPYKFPLFTVFLTSQDYENQIQQDSLMNIYINYSSATVEWISIDYDQIQKYDIQKIKNKFKVKNLLRNGCKLGRVIQKKYDIVVIPIGNLYRWKVLGSQSAILLNWKILPKKLKQLKRFTQIMELNQQSIFNYPFLNYTNLLTDLLSHQYHHLKDQKLLQFLYKYIIQKQATSQVYAQNLLLKSGFSLSLSQLQVINLRQYYKFCQKCFCPLVNYYVVDKLDRIFCPLCANQFQIGCYSIYAMYDKIALECPLVRTKLYLQKFQTQSPIPYQKFCCQGNFIGSVWYSYCFLKIRNQAYKQYQNHPFNNLNPQDILLEMQSQQTLINLQKQIDQLLKLSKNNQNDFLLLQKVKKIIEIYPDKSYLLKMLQINKYDQNNIIKLTIKFIKSIAN